MNANAAKWFQRAAGGLAGLVPAADDALYLTNKGKQILARYPQIGWGVRNIAVPLGTAAKLQFLDQSILGGASNRTLDNMTGGRYDAGTAWERSPKARFSRRHTHGYFVSPSNRMRRNTPQGQYDQVISEYRREGIEWRP